MNGLCDELVWPKHFECFNFADVQVVTDFKPREDFPQFLKQQLLIIYVSTCTECTWFLTLPKANV